MVENRVKAFALFHQDRRPVEEIADLLGVTDEQVMKWLEVEGKARMKLGTFPRTSLTPDRGHRITATKDAVCDDHGPYQSDQWTLNNHPPGMQPAAYQFWTKCPHCNRVMHDESVRRNHEIRYGSANNQAELRKGALRSSGIPERYLDCDVWHWQHGIPAQRDVWEVVKSYCMRIEDVIQHGRCLVFFGEKGTGKTHLACGIVRHVIERGGTALYETVASAIGRIRSTYSKDSTENEREVLDSLCRVDILVLDELGRQSDSAHEREMLFRILDRRYADLKPTVLASNLERKPLYEFLGQALCDRLLEAGGRFLSFDWASQRRRRPDSDTDKEQDR